MSLVEIDGATLRYGALTALSGLDLRLEPGEVLGLLGHNGAGKTTTIKLVLGLLAPARPRAGPRPRCGEPGGAPPARLPAGERDLLPAAQRRGNPAPLRPPQGVAPAEAARLLEQVGLGHAARRRLKTYSKGMRQRLGLAQALLGEPRLLLLDEPTVGLDPLATVELYQCSTACAARHRDRPLLPCAARRRDAHRPRRDSRRRPPASGRQPRRIAPQAALPTRVRLASPHNPQWLERWHRAGLAARRLDDQRIEVLLDDAERDGVLEALLAAREFDLEILPPSLEDLYRHHMSPPRRSHAMPVVWTIARKELADGLRNRWLLAISLLFALLSVGIAWFGAAAAGQVGFTSVPATVASLTSLATFLMPLIALLLAYDAIVGEEEGGTLLLL